MANERPESLLHRGLFRNSPPGVSAAPPLAQASRHHRGPGLDQTALNEAFNYESHKDRWMQLLKQVHEDYPYCTMYGVHVVDGAITACEQIQRSLMLGDDRKVPREILFDLFDMKWQALEALCLTIGNGRLVEVKFHDARPVIAITKEGGRRFKGILKKLTKA
jgi:hypothetical protein